MHILHQLAAAPVLFARAVVTVASNRKFHQPTWRCVRSSKCCAAAVMPTRSRRIFIAYRNSPENTFDRQCTRDACLERRRSATVLYHAWKTVSQNKRCLRNTQLRSQVDTHVTARQRWKIQRRKWRCCRLSAAPHSLRLRTTACQHCQHTSSTCKRRYSSASWSSDRCCDSCAAAARHSVRTTRCVPARRRSEQVSTRARRIAWRTACPSNDFHERSKSLCRQN